MTDDEEAAGVAAVILLQKVAGIVETEEDARIGWRGLSETQQANTLECARAFQ